MSSRDDDNGRPPVEESGKAAGRIRGGPGPKSAPDSPAEDRQSAAEEALDLSDLEAGGVGGVVAGLTDEEPVHLPRRRGRSPLLSVVVIAFGVYLMATMWPEFSYWLSSREPTDLGHARDLIEDGELPDDLDNRYVVLRGTPDVQHAARLSTKTRFVGYLRLIEGGGRLFAAIPRSKEEKVTNTFAGRYEGRMQRLGTSSTYPWIEQFFEQESIIEVHDSSPEALRRAIEKAQQPLRLETERGTVTLEGETRVRLVVDQAEANVQLGKKSVRTAEKADEAISSLGFPFVRLERQGSPFFSYLVRIPETDRSRVQDMLDERLAGAGDGPPPNKADPGVGAIVLSRTATYLMEGSDLVLEGATLRFPYGDNTATTGYEVRGDRLVERELGESRMMHVPMAAIRAVRVEVPVRVDPQGYLVMVGSTPGSMWKSGILWLFVAGITGLNVGSLMLWWRRRQSRG